MALIKQDPYSGTESPHLDMGQVASGWQVVIVCPPGCCFSAPAHCVHVFVAATVFCVSDRLSPEIGLRRIYLFI